MESYIVLYVRVSRYILIWNQYFLKGYACIAVYTDINQYFLKGYACIGAYTDTRIWDFSQGYLGILSLLKGDAICYLI